MNLIERAGRQLGLKSSKSFVERAADRLATDPVDAGTVPPPPVPLRPNEHVEHQVAKPPRRETRQRIVLDFDRLRGMGFALPGDQSSLAEEFRLIKRPLMQQVLSRSSPAPAKNSNMIMVTSAQPDEGKTFVAVNLAFSMASEHDLHVLLIDADAPKPTIPDVLGFEAKMGLTDLVTDSTIDFADVMIRTNIENLTILPSGPDKPGSSELLSSSRMARFVEEVSRRYPDRVIIFDAPPVLARSEPIVLAKHVGQVVVVMEAERTSRAALEEAIGLLGVEHVGVVLNKAPPVTRDQFGSHYAGYG